MGSVLDKELGGGVVCSSGKVAHANGYTRSEELAVLVCSLLAAPVPKKCGHGLISAHLLGDYLVW